MGDTMYAAVAWAKNSPDGVFEQIEIQRNVAGDDDVTFDVKFCGICHTDVHISNNDMVSNQNLDIIIITNYPCVPGNKLSGSLPQHYPHRHCHCHSHHRDHHDHQGMTNYPCVPGHELAGVVTAVGKNVTKYKVAVIMMMVLLLVLLLMRRMRTRTRMLIITMMMLSTRLMMKLSTMMMMVRLETELVLVASLTAA